MIAAAVDPVIHDTPSLAAGVVSIAVCETDVAVEGVEWFDCELRYWQRSG